MCMRVRSASTVEPDAKKPVSLLVFAILVLVVAHGAIADSDEATIEAFGVKRGEPINKGFFFSDGKYVDVPYVVERRGTDIYVNDHLLHRGMGLPSYDYTVSEDPGEPPSDTSPFDPVPENVDYRDTYWSRKLRYLLSHHPREDAVRMMLETWRKCTKVDRADVDENDPFRAILLSTDGRRKTVILTMSESILKPAWTKEQILEMREKDHELYENALRANAAIFDIGPEITCPSSIAVQAMNILMSSNSVQEKIEALRARSIGPDVVHDKLVTKFRGSPQLKERVLKLEKELEIQRLQADIIADARTATDAIADIGMARLSGQAPNAHDANITSDVGDKDATGEAPPSQESPLSQDNSVDVLGNVRQWLVRHCAVVAGGVAVLALAVLYMRRMSRSRSSSLDNKSSPSK